jgi:hypothetical protein
MEGRLTGDQPAQKAPLPAVWPEKPRFSDLPANAPEKGDFSEVMGRRFWALAL